MNLSTQLTEDIRKKREFEDEMERVRQELYLEEQEEAERQKEMAEIERRIRQRLELQQTYQQQLQLKEYRRQAELKEEEEFKQQVSNLSLLNWNYNACHIIEQWWVTFT